MLWDASADDLILSGAAGLIVPDGQFTLGSTAITSTGAEINILDGGNAASSVTLVDADRIIVNDNGTMKQVAISALNTYTSASIAADDVSAGDGAVNITTSSGNITIDAAASDADIIFKGTDDSSDITALTLDMSAAGAATFNDKVIATELDISGNIVGSSLFKMDVDTDADDVSGDSATGRLTLGAGEDLNLYHGGTHSYIVNDTGNLVIDTAGDLTFDAAGNDFKFLANGTEILNITNSSSDVVIKPIADTKDIIFQQRDGTEVARIEDNATFNVSSAGKFAYAGTAVTSTAAELNILDGVTSTAAELNILDGVTSTAAELNYVDGVTSNVQTQLDTKASTGKAIAMAIVFG
jgi:hypothetical protein